ncbi:MAG TPA: serine/threonine-protein kinase, partial [Thermoanaerobaculia bacterium]|nr:serine/threonine-protein kinase [Thermoanaerobaculia bacterium]
MELPASAQRSYGSYEVESTLGRGAMGMVYLARDRRIGRRVALKTVQVDQVFEDESETDEFYKRLQREAELSGSLQHPNIVTLYEAGYENDRIAFLATEYVDGETLKERLKRSRPLPLALALSIAEDVLSGLAFAHARGIV